MATPLCRYFGKCGGCSAQHIDYNFQLENKKKMLADAVEIDKEKIKIFSGNSYNYRNRMDFVFHSSGIGLREKGKWWSIVDIEKCVISNENLNKLLREARHFFKNVDYFDIKKKTGTFRYAVIRTPGNDSSISFVLNKNSMKISEAVERIKEFSEVSSAKNVIVTYVPANSDVSISEDFCVIKGKEFLEEEYLDRKFLYPVQGFFQNNHEMAEKMLNYSREVLGRYGTKKFHLLDLYGGVGSFGIINSELFKEVTIIENVEKSIECAKINAERNGAGNARMIFLDAIQLKKLEFPKELLVITDPPRSGMHPKTILRLKELKPKVILYVSCNIQQLGKDIPKFKEYKVKSLAMFDLFPQTPHIEAIAELELNQNE